MAQFIRIDIFPAEVIIDGAGRAGVRAIVTDDQILAYADAAYGPEAYFEAPFGDIIGDERQGWTATTTDGTIVRIVRSGGCGCGSRLKGFRPFPGVQHLAH